MKLNLHVDCDPLWVYAREYGAEVNCQDNGIYEEAAHHFLEVFAEFDVRATFFLIGRELNLPSCVQFCKAAIHAGHAIGNHTLSHLPALHAAGPSVRRSEIVECDRLIRQMLGYDCRALRMPGYYFDREIAGILTELNYQYDSSVLPGLGIYLMKAAYGLFNPAGTGKQFGRNWYLFARRSAYRISPEGQCWELPLATFPLLGLPIHSTFVFQWGLPYFNWALRLSRMFRSHMVYLFHLLDLVDSRGTGLLQDRVATLKVPLHQRRDMVRRMLASLAGDCVAGVQELLGRV
jgi:peptidoglycan/xylan/chitin deacetylase (PgdA/CDA1 family)